MLLLHQHYPGVQPADLEEVLSKGIDVLVIGRGMNEAMQVKVMTSHHLIADSLVSRILAIDQLL